MDTLKGLALFFSIFLVFNLESASIRENFVDAQYLDTTLNQGHWDTSSGTLKPASFEDDDLGGSPLDDEFHLGDGSDGACILSTFPNPINTDVKATYNCTSLNINNGETLNVSGSVPLYIKVLGTANFNGDISVSGGDGEDAKDVGNAASFNNAGSAGGAGGFAGGRGKGRNNGESGGEPAGGMSGSLGTRGGSPTNSISGGGGGGGHSSTCSATAGTNGNGGGTGGAAGNDGSYSQRDFPSGPPEFGGGAGGASGGGAENAWVSGGKFLSGGAGGGGGGAIAIWAGGNFNIAGNITADGGDGGDAKIIDVGRGAGAGGGGAGGSIWLHSAKQITVSGNITANGGSGGTTDHPGHGEGGNGGCGLIRIGDADGAITNSGTISPAAETQPGTPNYTDANYGEDAVIFQSLAYDLGPGTYTHSAPTTSEDTTNGTVTYEVDASNLPTSGWTGYTNVSSLTNEIDGYRYVRFRVTIDRDNNDAVKDAPPFVNFFQWNYSAGPSLNIDTASHDFGNIYENNLSNGIVVQITNTGDENATSCTPPTLGGSNPDQFEISADGCDSNNLAAADNCTFTLKAAPTSIGKKNATLIRNCIVGGSVTSTVDAIQVTGVLGPNLNWSPLTYSFGSIKMNSTSSTQIFNLTNSGTLNATGCTAAALTGSDPGEFSIVSQTCGTNDLPSGGGSCSVTVRGNPSTIGLKQATLTRTCTVGGTVATTADGIQVTGTETSSTNNVIDTVTNDFSGTVKGSGCGSVTITNGSIHSSLQFSLALFLGAFLAFLSSLIRKQVTGHGLSFTELENLNSDLFRKLLKALIQFIKSLKF